MEVKLFMFQIKKIYTVSRASSYISDPAFSNELFQIFQKQQTLFPLVTVMAVLLRWEMFVSYMCLFYIHDPI